MPSSTRSRSRTQTSTGPSLGHHTRRTSHLGRRVSFESANSNSTSDRKRKKNVRSLVLNTRKRRCLDVQDDPPSSDGEYRLEDNENSQSDQLNDASGDSDSDIQLQLLRNQPPPTNDVTKDQENEETEGNKEDDLLQRLADQFELAEEPSHQRTSSRILRQRLTHHTDQIKNSQAATHPEQVVLPTLHNYKLKLDKWPPARIAVQERSQTKKATSVSAAILKEAKAIRKIYKHQMAMLSIIGNVSKFTLDKAL
ncbi:uncharacterized protein MELLADRAFT_84438 [Melampsora larici-populina 98AG31]|uniref:Uncharacterized protein n=1 Tax=Melampsora larici-populina (strain 98AG31 / pathotype 3-4-7) TaxID=747676 RepID=F4RFR5_MELLP|nr:uncharacterized protein MELLADRAFT_84438 [Melampsora larici-populina 98AG31]EGG08885.1 hypothetical protein MELLADRAFT_84438 [Melampsora larici-populina 98AG31]